MLFETLEDRRLLSASLNATTRVLTVVGTGGADSIGIQMSGTGTLLVIDNGVNRPFAASKVSSIVVNGGAGNDDLHAVNAVAKPVTLNGGTGDDKLRGGGGKDVINGGDGNDNLDGNNGPDRFIGGPGTDTANYAARTVAVNVSLDDVANDGRAGEGDNVQSDVENVLGGSAGDVIAGSKAANVLRGNGGNDVLAGLGGDDALWGGAGNDTLRGGDLHDDLHGGDGNDLLDGGFGGDLMYGDAGVDTIDYSSRTVGVIIDLANGSPNGSTEDVVTVEFNGNAVDVEYADAIYTAENGLGGAGDDKFYGNAATNVFRGNGGEDDFFVRGGGKDYAYGGAGTDTADADASDVLDGIEVRAAG